MLLSSLNFTLESVVLNSIRPQWRHWGHAMGTCSMFAFCRLKLGLWLGLSFGSELWSGLKLWFVDIARYPAHYGGCVHELLSNTSLESLAAKLDSGFSCVGVS